MAPPNSSRRSADPALLFGDAGAMETGVEGSKVPVIEANGAQIPALGFGTGSLGGSAAEVVAHAIASGYRHIDAARKYGTEEGVGEGIRASGIARNQLFITTKVSHENLRTADFERSTEASLKALGVDYVDLLLIHWPSPEIPIPEPIVALAAMKRKGLTRHVGVANFPSALLEDAIRLSPEPLATDQVEYHPKIAQDKVLSTCRRHGLALTAHCPLARGRLFEDPVLKDIARARGKTVAQVALRWLIQQEGVAAIPRSSSPARVTENFAVFDLVLSEDEMARIRALRTANIRIADPAGRAPLWDAA